MSITQRLQQHEAVKVHDYTAETTALVLATIKAKKWPGNYSGDNLWRRDNAFAFVHGPIPESIRKALAEAGEPLGDQADWKSVRLKCERLCAGSVLPAGLQYHVKRLAFIAAMAMEKKPIYQSDVADVEKALDALSAYPVPESVRGALQLGATATWRNITVKLQRLSVLPPDEKAEPAKAKK